MHPNATRTTHSILLICDFRPGLLTRIMDIYRFFQKPPKIIVARRGGNSQQFQPDSRLNVELESIPLPVIRQEEGSSLLGAQSAIAALGYLLYVPIIYARIKRRHDPIQLVHAHYVFPQGLFGLLLATLLQVPLIVTAEGSDVNYMMRKNSVIRTVCQFILNHAQTTIAVSAPLTRWLRRFGVARCAYMPNSVDTSTIKPPRESARADRIIFAGGLIESKRPLTLIRAFDEVARITPTATLLVCGDGPLKEAVEREVVKRKLQDKVRMFGFVGPRSLDELRSQAALFVLPSESEGLSLALLEAMAAGQTIIASRNESNAAVIEDGKNGLLFELDDSEQLAEQIQLAIADKNLRGRLSRSARHLCETQFSNNVAAIKLESLYRETATTSLRTHGAR
jgi:glycosyltransferase involved in cell wall biosynthesis